jgi:hypothetical protein
VSANNVRTMSFYFFELTCWLLMPDVVADWCIKNYQRSSNDADEMESK